VGRDIPKEYDYLLKVVIAGASQSGKTSLLLRFVDNAFDRKAPTTIGVDFKLKTIELDGVIVKLQLWDTAGQERFDVITDSYYRGAAGLMVVYDITDNKSFDRMMDVIRKMQEASSEDAPMYVIGNKADLATARVISACRGAGLALEVGASFVETSAMTGSNVDFAFEALARSCISRLQLDAPRVPLQIDCTQQRVITIQGLSSERRAAPGGCAC
jgi:small GTP-binding protein